MFAYIVITIILHVQLYILQAIFFKSNALASHKRAPHIKKM